jgi:maltose alpha-D-glucosyltransferase/alpha-amylase
VRAIYEQKIAAQRIRCHCDYTLREVLYTGRDFVVIDFEGMPSRPLTDRRRKYTPLRDVASMVRSFQYASLHALTHGVVRREDQPALLPWSRLWYLGMGRAFLSAYEAAVATAGILPASAEERHLLLDFYLVKRALQEMRYELTRGPAGVSIPLLGLLQVLDTIPARAAQ